MSKIRCVCKTILSTSGEIPNPIEWKVMSDSKFDEFSGSVDAEEIYRSCGSIFRCPTCGRLWVFWNDLGEDPQLYAPESIEQLDDHIDEG
ncbi:hypothetical protein [Actinoallomurus soli]|uniref:hypothetical protein n=1 Tax=Actinoallomurus soli TaxID=2952535 RepID=UPI0020935B10|nr:hypothetical protein [Actinoallomurus soli]MCO5973360.1 hypothetical protein [Actinoallomurus soli]